MTGPTGPGRAVAMAAAALTGLVVAVPAANAAEGPYVFDSQATGRALTIEVGLPAALADALAPALDGLSGAGIAIEDGVLSVDLARTVAELELGLDGDVPAELPTALAAADPLTGSLHDLAATLAGGELTCLGTPVDVAVPPDARTPLVAFSLLQATCEEDPDGRTTVAATRVADLEVNLAGLLAQLPDEVREELTATFDEARETVDNDVVGPLVDDVQPILDGVGEQLGTEIRVDDLLRVPDLLRLPLLEVDLIASDSRSRTEGQRVVSRGTTTLTGLTLLGGLACVPDVTYVAEAFATGVPGSNDYRTEIPPIRLGVCADGELSRTLLTILEREGVINDVLIDVGRGDQSVADLLGATSDELSTLVTDLDVLLATLGVTSVAQGSESGQVRSGDGREAAVAVQPFSIGVSPLDDEVEDTPMEGVSVSIAGLGATAAVTAAPAPVVSDEEDVPVLPRTGGGTAAALLGLAVVAGALALRRRAP